MVERCKCEVVILVDGNGDYALGKDDDSAREAYANEIGALDEADGFRLVRLTVNVPLPVAVDLPEVDVAKFEGPTLAATA